MTVMENKASPITKPLVRVVDDDQDVRRSISSLLSTVGLESEVYASASEAVRSIDLDRPGCMVIDMRLPDRDGLDLLEELRAKGNDLPILIVTAYGDVSSAVRAMKAQAIDFIEKPFPGQRFISSVQKAVDRDLQRRQKMLGRRAIKEKLQTLSERERQVLDGIVAGLSSKMIAVDLGIKPKTVENYRASLMQKMDAENAAHLVALVYDTLRCNRERS